MAKRSQTVQIIRKYISLYRYRLGSCVCERARTHIRHQHQRKMVCLYCRFCWLLMHTHIQYSLRLFLSMVHFCVVLVPSLSCSHLFLTTHPFRLHPYTHCARTGESRNSLPSSALKVKKEHEYHSSSSSNSNRTETTTKKNEPYKMKCVCYIHMPNE